MRISEQGVALIKQFEGYEENAYQDIVGVWTIGFGTTMVDGQPVHAGMTCSVSRASSWLAVDVDTYLTEAAPHITTPLNQNQVDSIASFIYNLGVPAFKKSTLLKKINSGDMKGAAAEFMKWNKAGGKVVGGLTRRRKAEQELFLK